MWINIFCISFGGILLNEYNSGGCQNGNGATFKYSVIDIVWKEKHQQKGANNQIKSNVSTS